MAATQAKIEEAIDNPDFELMNSQEGICTITSSTIEADSNSSWVTVLDVDGGDEGHLTVQLDSSQVHEYTVYNIPEQYSIGSIDLEPGDIFIEWDEDSGHQYLHQFSFSGGYVSQTPSYAMVTDTYWTVYTVTSSGTLTGAEGQGCCADHSAIHLKLGCYPTLTKVDDVNDGNCVGPGEKINYRIDYNYPAGPDCLDINDVYIIDYLPDEVEYDWSEPEPNEILDCNKIIWEIGTLRPGDANYIKLKVRVRCIKTEPGSTITITNYCEIRDSNDLYGKAYEYTPVCANYNYLVVDDFEGYRNYDPNIIYKTWKDGKGYPGYPGNGTGSKAGYRDPNYAELTIVHGGRQSMPFDYNNIKPPYYSEATRTFATDQNWVAYKTDPNHIYPLKSLSLWIRGYPVYDGNFAETPPGSGIYTMKASGEGINVPNWRFPSRFRDEFHYAYIPIMGNGDIIVKVNSVSNTNAQAKAGLMIRDSLADDSAYAMVCIMPDPCNGVMFQSCLNRFWWWDNYNIAQTGPTPPCWLRLERHEFDFGGYFYNAWYSSCGPSGEPNNWTQLGEPNSVVINMTGTDYIGLAVTARNATATCTAVFSNVSGVTPPSPWTSHQDIGIKSNTAAPLYVTLQDSNNITATVDHNDPNIVLTTTWQPWDIDLRDFNGVDLTKVKKITIGVADSNGTGTLYFDDIRLYPSRCLSAFGPTADFTCDCVVDYRDLKIMTDEWLSTRCHRTNLYKEDPNIVNFKDFAILAEQWLEEKLWP